MHQSIRKTGLKAYLNETKEMHNGLGYIVFKTLIQAKVNKANLARAFNVSLPTMDRWLAIHREENTR